MSSAHATVNVFLAEDSRLIRDRIAALLSGREMTVVGAAETASESIAGILTKRPDVVVLDIALAQGSGWDVLQAVRREAPDVAVVIFSNSAGPAYRKRYLGGGADSFLDKNSEFESLAEAVVSAARARAALAHSSSPVSHQQEAS